MERSMKDQERGHTPDLLDLHRDVYELLAFFLSSKCIAELDNSPLYQNNDPIHQFGDLQCTLITKRVITVAITIRILDDQNSRPFDLVTDYCGTITEDVSNPIETFGLCLREACNKVIHAEKVVFDKATTSSGKQYLLPYLYLEGAKDKRTWNVTLDITKFCRESAAVLKYLMNGP